MPDSNAKLPPAPQQVASEGVTRQSPQAATESPTPVSQQVSLEEFKHVAEERRFVMNRYMQAVGLYLALSGWGLKELFETPPLLVVCIWGASYTGLNILAVYAAGQFKRMAFHAIARETELAVGLGMLAPYPLTWGYWGGIVVVVFSEATMIAILIFRLLNTQA